MVFLLPTDTISVQDNKKPSTMFYNQPLATRFGTSLISHIESGNWKKLDIAVAWVRATGLRHLETALSTFLRAGNRLTVVVGVDLDNTTKEGLEGLLNLESHGAASTFVHHNEAGTIFHPKLYLFQDDVRAKLIVGSNNITEAGLYQNTEAGLELEAKTTDEIIVSTINALDSWRDSSLGLARKLDRQFLNELLSCGYIKDEATVRAAAAARRESIAKKEASIKKLFGSVSVTPPLRSSIAQVSTARNNSTRSNSAASRKTTLTTSATSDNSTGQVLLMRVRKARGTQVQIPLAVMRTPFFRGVTQVLSVSTNISRGIHATHAARAGTGANPNTLKLEMPETRTMNDPVARFERTKLGIQYEVYDKNTAKGQTILQALQAGLANDPRSTFLTVPSSPNSSTWWRFI